MTDKDRIEIAIRQIEYTYMDPWAMEIAMNAMKKQIPIKPKETKNTVLDIVVRQAVCPVCDHYLPHIEFLSNFGDKSVTYCESCGQALDWKGWENNETN